MSSTVDVAAGPETPAEGDQVPLGAVRRTIREVGLAMITGGVVVLLFVTYQLWGTGFTERHDQSVLARQFAAAVHDGGTVTAPAAGRSTAGAPGGGADSPTLGGPATSLSPSTPSGLAIAHLVIPRIGVDKFVVQGTDESDLMEGPGHYVGTPFPGQPGNAAIAGHRTTYGAPFFRLDELRTGDPIYVTDTRGTTFVYRVVRQTIAQPSGPSAAAVLADTPVAELTLTTCNPRFEATNRLIVVADLVGRPTSATSTPAPRPAAATSKAPPTSTPTSTATRGTAGAPATTANLGQGDSGAWTPAIAFGAAALLLWVLTRVGVHRTRRWRRGGAFVVGVAACAVPLWFCFENVVRLLPQSI